MKMQIIGALALAGMCFGATATALEVGDPIPDRYIVVLETGGDQRSRGGIGLPVVDDVLDAARSLVERVGGETLYTFGPALPGFLARLSADQARQLERDARIRRVEQDRVVIKRDRAATWGLDRIDQRELPLDQRFAPPGDGGQGVHLYIIDTGLRATHNDFRGRVGGGANFAGSGPGPGLLDNLLALLHPGNADREDWDDCNGHGTHVASTAAGTRYGVARKATVYGVRVLGCDGSGTTSGVIAGVDWVLQQHRSPAVANLSLGGGASSSMDEAVQRLIAAGVTTVVAAGNDNADACNGSPNRVREAITVGATDRNDRRADFSNWGRCVDLFAPGHEIEAAWYQSDSQTRTISGTSMAAPHVAGAAALVLGGSADGAPAAVMHHLEEAATSGALSDLRRGSPNRLLFLAVPADSDSAQGGGTEGEPEAQRSGGGLLRRFGF